MKLRRFFKGICIILFISFLLLTYSRMESFTSNWLEDAISQGFSGNKIIKMKVEILGVKKVLKGEIKYLYLEIEDYNMGDFTLKELKGEFWGLRINLLKLLKDKKIVVRNLEKGKINIVLDNDNLSKIVKKRYPGWDIKIIDDKIRVGFTLNVLGKKVLALGEGIIVPAKNKSLEFKLDSLNLGGYSLPVAYTFPINISLREIPFTFQISTVKIRQGKILIQGKI